MDNKIKAILAPMLIAQMVFIPLTSFAEGRSQPISEGEQAPYSGLLLDADAVAKILADKEYQKKKCSLDLDYQSKRDRLDCDFKTSKLQLELEISKKKYDEITSIKDKQIKSLENLVAKSDRSSSKILLFVGGVVLGSAAAIGMGYAVLGMK